MSLSTVLHLLLHVISILYRVDSFSMKMIPIDSPQLKILPKHFTIKDRAYFLRNLSLSRSFYANKQNSKLGLNSIQSPFINIARNYFVTQFTIGTHNPPFSPYLILDTSTDQTWMQCARCEECFKLKTPFPVEESSSYSLMNLDDSRCSPRITYEGSCGFEVWDEKGHARGYMGTDTFSFTDTKKTPTHFTNIAFGCGIHNKDFPFGSDPDNVIAGVHGLALGPKSIITQLTSEIKGRFSYCIKSDLSNSTITFGDDAQITGDAARKVQTIAMNPNALYHLYLAAITLQGHRLPINPTYFELEEAFYSYGFFIDPGATFTVLTNSAYVVLRNAVIEHFSKYNLKPLDPHAYIFDLCYSNKPNTAKGQYYPSIELHFIKSLHESGEVSLPLDTSKVFGNYVNKGGFCMQILSTIGGNDGPSIFGAYQQADFQFLFDVDSKLLSFVPSKCQ
ncbi:hypothetical protein RND81_09G219600 [Saponaria officinalis]|uniref:Peptidase A1 domain-containing protein n=1 Tax=Saponaria officinalis TaxID=3572 RepID=A0AAW1IPP2_SAPOF